MLHGTDKVCRQTVHTGISCITSLKHYAKDDNGIGNFKSPIIHAKFCEMFMADENLGVEWLTDLCNLIVAEGRIPDDLSLIHI